jgi:hypothetical protein
MGKVRKPYEKPTVTKLTPQQAKQKLLGLVNRGDEELQKRLELMFPEARNRAKDRDKSA